MKITDVVHRLGHFIPEKPSECFVEMYAFLIDHGWRTGSSPIEHRTPGIVEAVYGWHSHLGFHHDGNIGDFNRWMAVWSNLGGTMIRVPKHHGGFILIIAQPYEVVVFNNHICEHAMPWPPPGKRHFLRVGDIQPKEVHGQ